jgi:hypothetical protein
MKNYPESKLIIISLSIPPEVCGVSDYAFHVAKAMQKNYDVVEVAYDRLPAGNLAAANDFIKVGFWKDLLLNAGADTTVLLNYTPRGYHNLAIPMKLILALRRFRMEEQKHRLYIIFHETWNGSKNLKFHHRVLDKFAIWSAKSLGNIASGIAVITSEQKRKVGSVLQDQKVKILNVGANIFPANFNEGLISVRESGLWVVFGLPHTRLQTLKTHHRIISVLIESKLIHVIKSIGPSDGNLGKEEFLYAEETFGKNILQQTGSLSVSAVSDLLVRAQGALIGQTADSLRKSGSFAAVAAHATPVICDVPATLLDPPGLSMFRPEELEADPAIFEIEKAKRSKQLHDWYWNTRSWDAIASDLLIWMKS